MIPNYERQNKWMNDYVLPIFTGELHKIPENYRKNKAAAREAERDTLRADMQKAGVFDSLRKLAREGPECDKPFKEFADAIDRKYVDALNKYDKISRFRGELGGPGIEYCSFNDCHHYIEYIGLNSHSNYVGTIKPDEKTLKLIREVLAVKEDPNPRGPAAAA
ncbi:MAG: hypothetical protein NTW67_05165 [Candidatus Woesearchaeota archaeon]|nr:hypothetical protein [Candidatus Woesearchaeota archaeon]